LEEFIAMSSACIHPQIYILGLQRNFRGGSGKKVKNPAHAAGSKDDGTVPAEAPSKGAIDRWINEKLQMLYGPVLSEPIPEQLAQLIAKHRRDQEDC
jgi:hypothetical protein